MDNEIGGVRIQVYEWDFSPVTGDPKPKRVSDLVFIAGNNGKVTAWSKLSDWLRCQEWNLYLGGDNTVYPRTVVSEIEVI